MEELLTARETAQLLRLSERSVRAMLRTGALPGAVRVGRSYRVLRQGLREWIERGGDSVTPREE